MSRIVILDGYTTNPGDLSWGLLEELGDLAVYDRTSQDKIIERAAGAEILLTNKVRIGRDTMEALPGLGLIAVMATGYDVVDIKAASDLGIRVCNVRGYSTSSVVQHTFSLILGLLNRTEYYSDLVVKGKWNVSQDFSFWEGSIRELDGKTMGIIGFGAIGQAVARVALAFGMEVIAYHTHPERDRMKDVKFLEFNEVLEQSNVISIHCPLREENYHMIGAPQLSLMRSSAVLINTARGGLVDLEAVIEAVNSGEIGGAGIDVLEQEPPSFDLSAAATSNMIITPHQAWASLESRKRLIEGLASNIRGYLAGEVINAVN